MKADKKKVGRLLKTARGQIDGVLKMMEDDRYCIDISNQVLATAAVLKKANNEILKAHIKHCVADSLHCDNEEEREKKIDELLEILQKTQISL